MNRPRHVERPLAKYRRAGERASLFSFFPPSTAHAARRHHPGPRFVFQESLAHGESAIIVPPISTAPAASRPTRVALSKRSSVEEMAKALEEEMALS